VSTQKAYYQQLLAFQTVERLIRVLELFSSHSELILNSCRVLSKLSLSERFAELIVKPTDDFRSLRTLASLLSKYPEVPHITIRVCFILANAVTLQGRHLCIDDSQGEAEVRSGIQQGSIGESSWGRTDSTRTSSSEPRGALGQAVVSDC
jgi:hypothetical protein